MSESNLREKVFGQEVWQEKVKQKMCSATIFGLELEISEADFLAASKKYHLGVQSRDRSVVNTQPDQRLLCLYLDHIPPMSHLSVMKKNNFIDISVSASSSSAVRISA